MTALAQAFAAISPVRRRVIYAYGAAVAIFVVGQLLHPGFAGANSIRAILLVASFVGLVAAGQTLVILIGGIDLSVPWVLNAAAILLVTNALGHNSRLPEALALTLGMGLAVGSAPHRLHIHLQRFAIPLKFNIDGLPRAAANHFMEPHRRVDRMSGRAQNQIALLQSHLLRGHTGGHGT